MLWLLNSEDLLQTLISLLVYIYRLGQRHICLMDYTNLAIRHVNV